MTNAYMPKGPGIPCQLVPRTYLELYHLLLQVKNELLHPGVVGFIVIKLFLKEQQRTELVSLQNLPFLCLP